MIQRFSEFIPVIEDRSVGMKIATLLLLIAVSTVLLMVIGVLLAYPFWGMDALLGIGQLDFMNDPKALALLKYFQVINQVGVFILPSFLFAYLMNRRPCAYLMLDRSFTFTFLFLSLLLMACMIPLINELVEWNEQMKLPAFLSDVEDWMRKNEDSTRQLTDAFLSTETIPGLIVNLFIIAFLAAVGEEFLFRGVVLKLMVSLFRNWHAAVLVSAILFSGLHLQFYGFIPRMALGMVFGYLFIWSGSLWVPIILHFMFNAVSVVAAYLYKTGIISTDLESFGATGNNLVLAGSLFLSIVLFYRLFRLSRKISQSVKPFTENKNGEE